MWKQYKKPCPKSMSSVLWAGSSRPASIWNKAWVHNGLSHPSLSSPPSTSFYEKKMQIEMPDWKYSTHLSIYQPIYQTGSLRFKDLGVVSYLTSTPCTFETLLVKSRSFCRTQKITILFFSLKFAAGLSLQNMNQRRS